MTMIHPQTGERTWIDEAADRFESDWKRGSNALARGQYLGLFVRRVTTFAAAP